MVEARRWATAGRRRLAGVKRTRVVRRYWEAMANPTAAAAGDKEEGGTG